MTRPIVERILLAAVAALSFTMIGGLIVAPVPDAIASAADDIGCAGNGTADDTDCLQRAIDRQKLVSLPGGKKFLVSRSIVISGPKTIEGNGAIITTTEGISVLTVRGKDVKVRGLALGSTNIRAQGIVLDDGAANIELSDNRIVGMFRRGILFGGPNEHHITIVGNTISAGPDGRIGYGLLVNPSRMARNGGAPPHDLIIKNNTILDAWGDAIEINSPPPVGVSNIVIEGNTLSAPHFSSPSAGFCIGMAGTTHVRIVGNKLLECKFQGIHIEHDSSDIVILNNEIRKTIGALEGERGWRRNSSGIILLNSHGIKIYNNRISNTSNAGIDLVRNSGGSNTDVTIAGNTISGAGDYGIRAGAADGEPSITIGAADGYPGNRVSGSKVADFAGCSSGIRGSDTRLRACGDR